MAFETFTPLIVYPADGVFTEFAIPDKFYDASDVKVFYVDDDGLETQYDFGTDYSVVVTATDPTPPARKSGKAVFVTPPINGGKVVVFVWPDSDQDQPFEGRPVTPRQNERVHDRHAMRDAALRELLFRGYRSTLDATPALRYIVAGREGYVPTWDIDGNLIEGPTVGQVATVAEFIDQINIVAGIEAEVVIVAGNAANINLVAGSIANVNIVGANIASVVTVATNIASVNTVAANIAAVNNVSVNMAAVLDAVNQANAAAASATLAQRWATEAEDVPVTTGPNRYSAFHWAQKAAALVASAFVSAVAGFTTKATPVAADLFGFVQASDTTGRKLTWAQLFVAMFTETVTTLSTAQQAQARKNIGLEFGYPMIHVEDRKASGGTTPATTASGNVIRVLNTVVLNEITGASLASNAVTLPAGSYQYEARAPAYAVGRHKIYLRNETAAAAIKHGSGAYNTPASGVQTDSEVSGKFTLAVTSAVAIYHFTEGSGNFGVPGNFGIEEVYAELKIWKLK